MYHVKFDENLASILEPKRLMKSHPEAGSRPAAEVVTQLPVPSHLGLLRFERLNEANWPLLYLDPACANALGVSASELCSLLDSPYASLMEPQARYALHDQIQQQLLQGPHYSVHYTLHSPAGPLSILEIGEPFKQRSRQMMRGYLIATPLTQQTSSNSLHEPQPWLRSEREQQARSRQQQELIVRLARQRYTSATPLIEAAQLITQEACALYDVDLASIWMLTETGLEAVSLYSRLRQRHEQPEPITSSDFPGYLQALHSGRAIDAHDALHDPRTRELASYLEPEGICSILDASIRVDGEVVGILCLEHTSTQRIWRMDEIAFAGELADQYAQVMTNQQRRSTASALHLFQRAVEQSASSFLLVDRDGKVEYVNPSFTAITQYSSDEVCGQRLADLPALANLSDLLTSLSSSMAEHNSWQGELRSHRKNQEPYWAQLSLSKVYNEDNELTHYIGIYEDITENKLAQQNIERLAFTDNLTNLGNRPAFMRDLEERFARPQQVPFWLLLVDVDNFKRINDSLGHKTGDKLLSSLARRLRNVLGQGCSLARFASNEFAILIDATHAEIGKDIAQRVLDTIDKPMFVDNQLINISASVGLAAAPEHGSDPQTLLKHAGLALHKAKANGKHQLLVFTETLNAEANHKLFVENNLRRALAQNELEVFYQPKLCLRTSKIVGLEALLRWHHPEHGMIRPDQFISVAEETGLIIPIGKWVIRQACRMTQHISAIGLGSLQMAVNLSPKQFSDPELVNAVREILRDEQLPAQQLEFELTESLLLDASDDIHSKLTQLKSLGLTLAMDDFGTGYSSLSYLKKFPIDVIKIDRSFVKDIPDNQDDMEITSAVIAMAHNLKLDVVAEGIETKAQLDFLRTQKCDVGQGFLFDQPIASRTIIDSLRRYPCRKKA